MNDTSPNRPRFNRSRHITAAICFLLFAFCLLYYRGPGWRFLRFYAGDVAAVAFLYHVLSLVWRGPRAARAGAVLTFALGIELLQWARLAASRPESLEALVVGSTFDPGDLAAYVVGVLLAVGIDAWPGRIGDRGIER